MNQFSRGRKGGGLGLEQGGERWIRYHGEGKELNEVSRVKKRKWIRS